MNDPFYSTDIKPDQATYDDLVMSYANAGVEAENLNVSADYCQKVIGIFSSGVSDAVNSSYTQRVNEEINEISSKIKGYYDTIDQLARDYNSYQATQYIVNKSSVNTTANVPLRMHILVAALIGFGFGVVLAIAIEVIKRFRELNGVGAEKQKSFALAETNLVEPDEAYLDDDDGSMEYYDVLPEESGYVPEELEQDVFEEQYPGFDLAGDGLENLPGEWDSDEVFEGNSFEDEEESFEDLSEEDLAAMEDIKNYSSRPMEYDPEIHYKWPENFKID